MGSAAVSLQQLSPPCSPLGGSRGSVSLEMGESLNRGAVECTLSTAQCLSEICSLLFFHLRAPGHSQPFRPPAQCHSSSGQHDSSSHTCICVSSATAHFLPRVPCLTADPSPVPHPVLSEVYAGILSLSLSPPALGNQNISPRKTNSPFLLHLTSKDLGGLPFFSFSPCSVFFC